MSKSLWGRCAVLLVVVAGVACGTSRVTDATYPATYQYISDQDVRATMHELAASVTRIDELLRADAPATAEDTRRAEIVALLGAMQTSAARLSAPGQETNHAQLDRHLDAFLIDVARAKEAAERDPPNWFLAGSISGSCLACHADRGGFAPRR